MPSATAVDFGVLLTLAVRVTGTPAALSSVRFVLTVSKVRDFAGVTEMLNVAATGVVSVSPL
jgi:hypothetical protein